MLTRALVVGLGLLLALVLLVLLLPLLRNPGGAQRRVLALFRRPERSPAQPGADHYYRPYWS